MIRPGDLVLPYFRATSKGLPLPMGLCRIIRPVGTVPNFFEVERLDKIAKGQVVKCFVYEEELYQSKFRVIEGVDNGQARLD